jgi:hypothetical protein
MLLHCDTVIDTSTSKIDGPIACNIATKSANIFIGASPGGVVM